MHMMMSTPPRYAVSQVVGYVGGEECNPTHPGVRGAETRFCGEALLGMGVFGFGGGSERGCNPRIYLTSGAGRQASGSVEPVSLTGHLQVAPTGGAE